MKEIKSKAQVIGDMLREIHRKIVKELRYPTTRNGPRDYGLDKLRKKHQKTRPKSGV
jgi:hypothetical protein